MFEICFLIPSGQRSLPLPHVKRSTDILLASLNIVCWLGIRSGVRGGFEPREQVSLLSVNAVICCDFVGVESPIWFDGKAADGGRPEDVIGGLMQSLLGSKLSYLWRNLQPLGVLLCWMLNVFCSCVSVGAWVSCGCMRKSAYCIRSSFCSLLFFSCLSPTLISSLSCLYSQLSFLKKKKSAHSLVILSSCALWGSYAAQWWWESEEGGWLWMSSWSKMIHVEVSYLSSYLAIHLYIYTSIHPSYLIYRWAQIVINYSISFFSVCWQLNACHFHWKLQIN